MPIPAELQHFYGPHWRKVIRPRILARAKNKCEQCGVTNHESVYRVGGLWLKIRFEGLGAAVVGWVNTSGEIITAEVKGGYTPMDPTGAGRAVRLVRIVLTIAHLDHTPGHDDEVNLKALCQWCHLNYDKLHHADTRAARKDQGRPLLAIAPAIAV